MGSECKKTELYKDRRHRNIMLGAEENRVVGDIKALLRGGTIKFSKPRTKGCCLFLLLLANACREAFIFIDQILIEVEASRQALERRKRGKNEAHFFIRGILNNLFAYNKAVSWSCCL